MDFHDYICVPHDRQFVPTQLVHIDPTQFDPHMGDCSFCTDNKAIYDVVELVSRNRISVTMCQSCAKKIIEESPQAPETWYAEV